MTKLKYRADIDGLRGLSVIAVILYHAKFGLPGGFIGVDIFFVISGFLITSLIAGDLDAGTFTLRSFWDRRIRRIWPLSLFLMLVVFIGSWFLMMPQQLVGLSHTMIAQGFLSANIYFWKNLGYFQFSAESHPLLHMWSLAVEEQFYILFPIILMTFWRFGKRFVLSLVILIVLSSFILSIWAVPRYPGAAFYLLPTRAWELGIGSVLALAPLRVPASRLTLNLLAIIGLGLIVVPCFTLSRASEFPGMNALSPCIGASLLIFVGMDGGCRVSKLLGHPVLRQLGLLSYSLYLWHWPILVGLNYLPFDWHGPLARGLAVLVTFPVSYLSWRLIENPFRYGYMRNKSKAAAGLVLSVSLGIIVLSWVVSDNRGVPSRFDSQVVLHGTPDAVPTEFEGEGIAIGADSVEGRTDLVLWGDSHAMSISEVIHDIGLESGLSGSAYLRPGSVPVTGLWMPDKRREGEEARDWAERAERAILASPPRMVLLVARWSVYLDSTDAVVGRLSDTSSDTEVAVDILAESLSAMISQFDEANIQVIIMPEVPLQEHSPQSRSIRAHLLDEDIPDYGVIIKSHTKHQARFQEVLARLRSESFVLFDPSLVMFEGERSRIGLDGRSFYSDTNHLNRFGSETLLKDPLRQLLRKVYSD